MEQVRENRKEERGKNRDQPNGPLSCFLFSISIFLAYPLISSTAQCTRRVPRELPQLPHAGAFC
jgi:hypothetical protein